MSKIFKRALALSALIAIPGVASAQELAENTYAAATSDIVVLGRRIPPSQEQAADRMAQIPGGVDLVPFEDFSNRYAVSFADTLRLSPGVIADPRFGEEVRLSVRGSGLSRGFHMRGLDLSLDGAPINLSDGAGDFQEIDPLSAQRIEVYRGGNALRFGGASLGGAINLATPTGRDLDAPVAVRIEAGSHQTLRQNVRAGFANEAFDLFGAVTHNESEGARNHDDGESTRVALNSGVRWSAGETRASLFLSDINQHLPGSLTRAQALSTPEMAASAAAAGDQSRDIRSTRAILTHRADLGLADVQVGAWGFDKSLYHQISPAVLQDSFDWGAFARLEDEHETGFVRRWTIGASFSHGDIDARQFQNINGVLGPLVYRASQDAQTSKLYGEIEFGLSERLSGIIGVQAIRSERFLNRIATPGASAVGSVPSAAPLSALRADESFQAINPKIGFLYQASDDVTIYGNVSRSFEPPTFTEWVQSGQVKDIDAQAAWTAEIGARGEAGSLTFDVALYRAQLKNEMLQYTINPALGIPASTFNADDTIHQGVEAYVQWHVLHNDVGGLMATLAYTFSDFRFDGDAQYHDNRIAGAARHQIHGELSWHDASGWYVTPNLNWIPEDVDVDFANTTKAPGYSVWGLQAGYDLPNGVTLFLDARNLTDENYISTFSTATCVQSAGSCVSSNTNPSSYYPGEGRAVYVGATFRLGAE
jgi:iron complex outermembrane receptor protein